MGGNLIEAASVQIPLKNNVVTVEGLLKSPPLMQKLEKLLRDFSATMNHTDK